jgi:hypothetical protein
MINFIHGFLAMGCLISGVYFLRFWRQTRDRLFLIFALAFWVLGVERLLLSLTMPEAEYHAYIYLVRLSAFLLIIGAIIDKNRSPAGRGESGPS